MLTKRYMTSVKNIPSIMEKIVQGTAPDKFTVAHLKGIGFKSSNDIAIISMLKDFKFLTQVGVPTERYHLYRDKSKSKKVLGDALKEAYGEIFHINENPSDSDRQQIIGKFKSAHNVSDRVAEQQAITFYAFLKIADISKDSKKILEKPLKKEQPPPKEENSGTKDDENNFRYIKDTGFSGLRYNIEIHLPATKDIEVFNAIFKSLKEHLIDS